MLMKRTLQSLDAIVECRLDPARAMLDIGAGGPACDDFGFVRMAVSAGSIW